MSSGSLRRHLPSCAAASCEKVVFAGFRGRVGFGSGAEREGGRRGRGLGVELVLLLRCDGMEGAAAVVGAQQVCEAWGALHQHVVMPGRRRITRPASTAAQVLLSPRCC